MEGMESMTDEILQALETLRTLLANHDPEIAPGCTLCRIKGLIDEYMEANDASDA